MCVCAVMGLCNCCPDSPRHLDAGCCGLSACNRCEESSITSPSRYSIFPTMYVRVCRPYRSGLCRFSPSCLLGWCPTLWAAAAFFGSFEICQISQPVGRCWLWCVGQLRGRHAQALCMLAVPLMSTTRWLLLFLKNRSGVALSEGGSKPDCVGGDLSTPVAGAGSVGCASQFAGGHVELRQCRLSVCRGAQLPLDVAWLWSDQG